MTPQQADAFQSMIQRVRRYYATLPHTQNHDPGDEQPGAWPRWESFIIGGEPAYTTAYDAWLEWERAECAKVRVEIPPPVVVPCRLVQPHEVDVLNLEITQ